MAIKRLQFYFRVKPKVLLDFSYKKILWQSGVWWNLALFDAHTLENILSRINVNVVFLSI